MFDDKIGVIYGTTKIIWTSFSIKEDIKTPKSIEKIRNAFSFYENEVLPLILNNQKVTQKKEWYHELCTHTKNVVFRGICYAVSLWKDPVPVIFACACHDVARTHDDDDFEHWKNAIPIVTELINNDNFNLSENEKVQIIEAVRDHSLYCVKATNYISACLWDADRTRLSWECGYYEKHFNTELWKIVSSWSSEDFFKFQNFCLNS